MASAASGRKGRREDGVEADEVEAKRVIAAARAGSVLIAVQGAAACRYSLPATQMARSSCAALRNSIASMCAS